MKEKNSRFEGKGLLADCPLYRIPQAADYFDQSSFFAFFNPF
jgi:hypothetical protein